jgi:hypothetical protein
MEFKEFKEFEEFKEEDVSACGRAFFSGILLSDRPSPIREGLSFSRAQ